MDRVPARCEHVLPSFSLPGNREGELPPHLFKRVCMSQILLPLVKQVEQFAESASDEEDTETADRQQMCVAGVL